MKPSLIVENSWKIKWFYFSLPTFAHLDLGSNIKTDKNKIVSKRPSFSISGSDHFLKNKVNQTQPTRIPSLTGPQAEMKPILEAPQIYFDQQENIYPSSDEVFSEEIQSHSYNSEDWRHKTSVSISTGRIHEGSSQRNKISSTLKLPNTTRNCS